MDNSIGKTQKIHMERVVEQYESADEEVTRREEVKCQERIDTREQLPENPLVNPELEVEEELNMDRGLKLIKHEEMEICDNGNEEQGCKGVETIIEIVNDTSDLEEEWNGDENNDGTLGNVQREEGSYECLIGSTLNYEGMQVDVVRQNLYSEIAINRSQEEGEFLDILSSAWTREDPSSGHIHSNINENIIQLDSSENVQKRKRGRPLKNKQIELERV